MEIKVGMDIYVPSASHISRGSEDVVGGLARINKIEEMWGLTWVSVDEHPGAYNWEFLSQQQDELKKEFGDKRAYPDPDIDTSWIEDGDIIQDGKIYHGPPIW